MWCCIPYRKLGKKEINKRLSIIAEADNGNKYLLLPQISSGSYHTIGYNWFNSETMNYNSNKTMFKFPGQLGTYLGGMERGWLIAFAAGFKKGKSFMLQ